MTGACHRLRGSRRSNGYCELSPHKRPFSEYLDLLDLARAIELNRTMACLRFGRCGEG